MDCVQLLLDYEADLGATNEDGQTPADLAKARGHDHIAISLEAKMVFSVRTSVPSLIRASAGDLHINITYCKDAPVHLSRVAFIGRWASALLERFSVSCQLVCPSRDG